MQIEHSELMWLDEQHEVSLDELAELSALTQQELTQLVESGVLTPSKHRGSNYFFNSHCLVSIRKLSRLKQDFDLDANALGLILAFLERIRMLEQQLSKI